MISSETVVVLTFLLLAKSCESDGSFRIAPRIIGGHDAAVNQFPYIVSIRDARSNKHFCGAAVITTKNILSAGHCLIRRQSQPNSVYTALGVYHRTDAGVRRNIDKIHIHPGFNFTYMRNDISIITVVDSIVFTDKIQPIALPSFDVPENGDLHTVLSGWGRTKNSAAEIVVPDTLQWQDAVTISLTECKKRLARLAVESPKAFEKCKLYFHKDLVCTKNDIGKGGCNGDSGGPLVAVIDGIAQIVGISSWGVNCGVGYPDVYTSVYRYSKWIQEQITST